MPFIRVTRFRDDVVMDVNINKITAFSVEKGEKYTTLYLSGDDVYAVKDTPRQLRGYIKKAEGLLPEKEVVETSGAPALDPRVLQERG